MRTSPQNANEQGAPAAVRTRWAQNRMQRVVLAAIVLALPISGQAQDVASTIDAAADALGMVRTVARRMAGM